MRRGGSEAIRMVRGASFFASPDYSHYHRQSDDRAEGRRGAADRALTPDVDIYVLPAAARRRGGCFRELSATVAGLSHWIARFVQAEKCV